MLRKPNRKANSVEFFIYPATEKELKRDVEPLEANMLFGAIKS